MGNTMTMPDTAQIRTVVPPARTCSTGSDRAMLVDSTESIVILTNPNNLISERNQNHQSAEADDMSWTRGRRAYTKRGYTRSQLLRSKHLRTQGVHRVITYHQVKGMVDKMAALSTHIGMMQTMLPKVIQLSEKIDILNDELLIEREKISKEIEQVELLEKVLKKHLVRNSGSLNSNRLAKEIGAVESIVVEAVDTEISGKDLGAGGQPRGQQNIVPYM